MISSLEKLNCMFHAALGVSIEGPDAEILFPNTSTTTWARNIIYQPLWYGPVLPRCRYTAMAHACDNMNLSNPMFDSGPRTFLLVLQSSLGLIPETNRLASRNYKRYLKEYAHNQRVNVAVKAITACDA